MNNYLSSVGQIEGNISSIRVLLIMPPDVAPAYQPHLGLGILASSLTKCGYDVLVVDYSYLASFQKALPNICDILADFLPDVVGISLFSQHLNASLRFVVSVNEILPDVPIIVGGPHVSLGTDDQISEVINWPGIKTIVRGEAESDIGRIVREVYDGKCITINNCMPSSLSDYIRPDFGLFVNGNELRTYPIQLSRGCPYECVFCNIDRLAGRKFRKRDIVDCIDEIREASGKYPLLEYVKVTDDAPNCDSGRFDKFIEQYISAGIAAKLEVMQLRADHLTKKSCELLQMAGQPSICIGVESADPHVLACVNKGETLEQIERACAHIKSLDMPLVMCFVLGLPGATTETDYVSIAFARKFKPVHCYWNIAQPMPGTKMYEHFLSNGTIYSENTFSESSLEGGCYADTPEYSRIDRLRMQVIAQASTNELTFYNIKYLLRRSISYGVFWGVIKAMMKPRASIPREIPRRW